MTTQIHWPTVSDLDLARHLVSLDDEIREQAENEQMRRRYAASGAQQQLHAFAESEQS